jgi:hypothetical protein
MKTQAKENTRKGKTVETVEIHFLGRHTSLKRAEARC